MLTLKDFDHLRSDKRIKFKTEIVNGHEVTIVSYMIADSDLWEKPLALETRGITFNDKGEVIARPFEKFFSVGEIPSNAPHLIKDQVIEVYEKLDGSMVYPVLIGGQIQMKTKKSFFSDIALEANECRSKTLTAMCLSLIYQGYTPIFEYTSPNNRIVLSYGNKPEFTLLTARQMDTGEYMEREELEEICQIWKIPLVKKYVGLGYTDLQTEIKDLIGFEGFVCVLADGRRIKMKTPWYITNHRIFTDLRIRDVAEAVVDERVDEIKTMVASEGKSIMPIVEIEEQVVSELSSIIKEVEYQAQRTAGKTIKEIAVEMKNHEFFALIMYQARGMEPKYVDFWKKNYLKNYRVVSVFNERF